jgi:Tol biopolymer transport system component
MDGIGGSVNLSIGAVGFGVSENGTLAFRSSGGVQTQLVWVDRAGRGGTVVGAAGSYGNIALSPDDKRVAFDRPGPTNIDVWLIDLQRQITSRFTFQQSNVPVWSADGLTIAFAGRARATRFVRPFERERSRRTAAQAERAANRLSLGLVV